MSRDRGQPERQGRTFVVTGANSGIGFATARALVDHGAHVVLAVRDTTKGDEAAARLAGRGTTSVAELDLSDLDQVADAAKRFLDDVDELTGLICNAGIMGGLPLVSAQGFELQMATNHLGHVALIAGLWPLLHQSASRVVVLSSNEAKRGQLSATTTQDQLLSPDSYDGKQVYRNTKQANLLFAQELHRRCASDASPVSAVAVHPGAVSTNLFARQLERSGRARFGSASKAVTSVLLGSPRPEREARSARSTLRRRAGPSSRRPGSRSSAANPSSRRYIPPARIWRRGRLCGRSPNR
jgi:NAD(P)-dependent dehydrogenase (short-subunit alcohol dehydrogenase family)